MKTLTETSVALNAALSAYTLRQAIAPISPLALRAILGAYLLGSREVWALRGDGSRTTGLACPPQDTDAFASLSEAMLASDRIPSMLNGPPRGWG